MLHFVDFPCYSNRGHDVTNGEWWGQGIASHRALLFARGNSVDKRALWRKARDLTIPLVCMGQLVAASRCSQGPDVQALAAPFFLEKRTQFMTISCT
jgi:hypothetical protein